jgi:hypothetical protein
MTKSPKQSVLLTIRPAHWDRAGVAVFVISDGYIRLATLLLREGEPWLRYLRFVITTSTEQTFTCKPDAKLLGKLGEAVTKLKREAQARTCQ